MNSCLDIASPRFGLGMAVSHAPACGSDIAFSLAWSRVVEDCFNESNFRVSTWFCNKR